MLSFGSGSYLEAPCTGKVTPVQVKGPYRNLNMVSRLSSCNPKCTKLHTCLEVQEDERQFIEIDRAYPGSEFVVANTLAKWKKLEPKAKVLT